MQPQLVHDFLCPARDLHYAAKWRTRPGVEVDDAVVGEVERLHSRVPGIHRHGAKLDDVQQRGEISSDNAEVRRSALRMNRLGAYCIGRIASVLLKERRAGYTVGKSLEYQRPVLHDRQNERSNLDVIPHEVAFGELLRREKNLTEVGHVQGNVLRDLQAGFTTSFLYCGKLGEELLLWH